MTRPWANPRRFDQTDPLVKAGLLNIHMTTPEKKEGWPYVVAVPFWIALSLAFWGLLWLAWVALP